MTRIPCCHLVWAQELRHNEMKAVPKGSQEEATFMSSGGATMAFFLIIITPLLGRDMFGSLAFLPLMAES